MPRPARLAACLVLLALAESAGAQTVDRPALGPAPAFQPPAVERFELSNGLPVLFVPKPGVPLVQVDLLVKAGAVADPEGRGGLASLTADLMDEGAGGRTALELADAVDYLGIDLTSRADLQSLQVRLHTPVSKLDSALALFADVALRPTFAEAELERLRASRLTSLAQRRDESRAIASVLVDQTLYGDASPYGRPTSGSPASVGALTRADVEAFHDAAVRPGNAALVVVGAVDRAAIAPRLEALFGAAAWPEGGAGGALAGGAVPEPTQVTGREVYLVDKPGAAQTVVRIGRVGAARSTPDYAALQVLNTILGGSFTSRLNQNLRETNGYTYGAGSSFSFRPVAGPFVASADVQTDVTGPALAEFFRELDGIRTRVPDEELAKARNYLALSFPEPFGSVRGTAALVGALYLDGLPLDAYDTYTRDVLAVTADDLERVAAEYVDPAAVAVVLVGDRATIEDEVRALDLGPLQTLTIDDVLGPQE
ncbi:pitrilysin family protein [Rubrivirga sp. S365]|uniref:M16 family metallopeptidase n=1 Tax=Rubrivirga sp. S365 TaxID=3076080 RepID=UPI0028CADCCD|nr:pitrilysin family protein [Rubrivirga sp. S365]MDT7857712.1 pitrilysin family protein [Rubrivirga sp. S365]